MTIEYRQIQPAEFRKFGIAIERGFGFHYSPNSAQFRLDKEILPINGTMCAFEDGELVGTTAAIPFDESSIQGGTIRNAGVTAVGVSTTHRRQGLLTNMMQRLLRQEREKGFPVASLWASESSIYGRFGYGVAIHHENFRIDTRRAKFTFAPNIPGRIRFVDADEARKLFPQAWEAAREVRAGIPSRDDVHWDRWAIGLNDGGSEWGKPWTIVYEEDGKILGYAKYQLQDLHVFGEQKHGAINADDIVTSSPASHAAIWTHLLNVDLYDTLTTWRSPIDDGLPWMLEDQRQLERMPYDAIWYRMLDIQAALESRTYLNDGSVVFEVVDEFLPECGGRFKLEVQAGRGTCLGVTEEPDFTLPTASLGAIFIGGSRLTDLERAGRVDEHTDGSLAATDRMFSTIRAPWCPMMF
jgi:predicted acetyltransferase